MYGVLEKAKQLLLLPVATDIYRGLDGGSWALFHIVHGAFTEAKNFCKSSQERKLLPPPVVHYAQNIQWKGNIIGKHK